jgi:prepilin-type N-terminal cleavage/methylation domain-containing protein
MGTQFPVVSSGSRVPAGPPAVPSKAVRERDMRRRNLQRGFTLIELMVASAATAAAVVAANWAIGFVR